MPTVLLTVDARDQSSAVLQRVQQALSGVTQALSAQEQASQRVTAAIQAQASVYSRLGSALDTVATALARMGSASKTASSALDAVARMTASVNSVTASIATSADAATSAMNKQATAANILTNTLKRQAEQASITAKANNDLKASGGGGSGNPAGESSSGGGHGLGSSLITGGAYYAAYMAASAVTSSISRDATYSRTTSSTAAETNLTPAQTSTLSDAITAMAASGKQPYDRNTLMQGAYSLASLGIGSHTSNFPGAVAAITNISAKMSAAAGATDTSSASDAIVSVLNDFGLNNKNVVSSAGSIGDQLQVASKLAKAELPQFATSVAGPANIASKMGISSSQVLGFMAAESAGGIANTNLADPFNALLTSSLAPNRSAQRVAKGLGIDYNATFWGKNGLAGGENIIENAMTSRGLKGGDRITALDKLFGDTGITAYLASRSGGLSSVTQQVQNSGGAVNTAYSTSQLGVGAQLLNAETQLKTAFDKLIAPTLPDLVSAAHDAAVALGLIADSIPKSKPVNPAKDAGLGIPFASGSPMATLNIPDLIHNITGWGLPGGTAGGPTGPRTSGPVAPSGGWNMGYRPGSADMPYGTSGPLLPGQVRSPGVTGGIGGGLGPTYTGPMGADWVRNNIVTGAAGAGSKDADMKRFDNLVHIAISQGQSVSTVQSALGLYTQAVKQNAMLSGSDKTVAINKEQALVAKYTGNINNSKTMPFNTPNLGPGGLEAGQQNTVVRFGGGKDPQAQLIAKLEAKISQDNAVIQRLLQQIATNTATQKANTARTSPFAGTGTNRMAVR